MRKITHYLANTGYFTKAKNKLEKEFQEYLESLDGLLVDADKGDILMNRIVDKATELNGKHSRCTPLKIQFYEGGDKDSFFLSGLPCLRFNLLYAYYESN